MIRNKQAGFTLIEIIVAFAVLAIVASIAVPALLSQMPKWRLNGAARQVMGDLMAARMKAVKLNHRVKVFFVDDHQYEICDDVNEDATVTDREGDVEYRDIHSQYPDVTVINANDPVFRSRGTAANRTITLKNSSGSKDIIVNITGRVRIE
ncbi:MAG: type II secretion system protein [Desulfobacterales bacterium]|nr:type II secretion system protein [Desulfobacterales bacterium]